MIVQKCGILVAETKINHFQKEPPPFDKYSRKI